MYSTCKYSKLHPNASLTTTNTNTTITLEHDSTQHDNGLALSQGCSGLWGTLVGPGRTPSVHRCLKGKAVGGPQLVPRQTTARQTTSLEANVLSANRRQDARLVQQQVLSHLEFCIPGDSFNSIEQEEEVEKLSSGLAGFSLSLHRTGDAWMDNLPMSSMSAKNKDKSVFCRCEPRR